MLVVCAFSQIPQVHSEMSEQPFSPKPDEGKHIPGETHEECPIAGAELHLYRGGWKVSVRLDWSPERQGNGNRKSVDADGQTRMEARAGGRRGAAFPGAQGAGPGGAEPRAEQRRTR